MKIKYTFSMISVKCSLLLNIYSMVTVQGGVRTSRVSALEIARLDLIEPDFRRSEVSATAETLILS